MPNNRKPGVLSNLRLNRVALVDMGANFDKKTGDGAHIMLWKRAEPGDVAKDSPGLSSVHVDTAGADPDEKEKERRRLEAQSSLSQEQKMKKSFWGRLLGAIGEADVTKRAATIEELAKEADAMEKAHDPSNSNCDCADCAAKVAKKAEDDKKAGETVVSKKIEDVEKQNVDLKKQNEDLAKRLGDLEKKDTVATVTGVIKSFKHVALTLEGDNNDLDKFVKMYQSDRTQFDHVIALLKNTDRQMETVGAFGTVGSSRSGGGIGKAWAEIEAKAGELVSKAKESLTKEQAIEKVMLDPANKELVLRNQQEAQ